MAAARVLSKPVHVATISLDRASFGFACRVINNGTEKYMPINNVATAMAKRDWASLAKAAQNNTTNTKGMNIMLLLQYGQNGLFFECYFGMMLCHINLRLSR
jgi:hypothetical protein